MDAVTEFVAEKLPEHDVQRFIVGGGSKVNKNLLFSSVIQSFVCAVSNLYSDARKVNSTMVY